MHELFIACKIGVTTGLTMFAISNANIEDGRVSIAVAVTCTVFICGMVWWLASKFQKLTDANNDFRNRLGVIELQLRIGNARDRRIDGE